MRGFVWDGVDCLFGGILGFGFLFYGFGVFLHNCLL